MLISTLVLLSLFIVGFLATYFNFPTKKFTSWFQSSLKNPNPPSSHVNITRHELSESLKKSTSSSTSTSKSSKTHERDELKSVFATFDKNKDGHITRQELSESLKRIGIATSERDVGEMVERVDSNGDGLIDFGEFCELFDSVMSREGASQEGEEGELKEAFDVFDGNGDGLITVEELGLVLGSLGMKEGKRLEDCKEMIRKVDVDGDGMISFDEFRSMMKSGGRLVDVS